MKKTLYFFISLLFLPVFASSQAVWSLQECIDYAMDNIITIQQSSIRQAEADIRLKMARNERLPSINSNMGNSFYFGRGPARDGTYEDNDRMYASLGVSMSLNLFNGLRLSHSISSQKFNAAAAKQDTEKLKRDVVIYITSYYLQVLLSQELYNLVQKQLQLSESLMKRTEILCNMGKATEADMAESESVHAKAEYNATLAENHLKESYLDLKHAVNYTSEKELKIKQPRIPDENIAERIPSTEEIFDYVLAEHPQIKAYEYRKQASLRNISLVRSYRYPSLNFNSGYNNNYYYSYAAGYNNREFSTQIQNNGHEYLGVSLNIPLFSKFSTNNQVKIAKLNYSLSELSLTEAKRGLRKELERLNLEVASSAKRYTAAVSNAKAADKVFNNERNKYDMQVTTVYRYNDAIQTMQRAESEMLQSKYEYIFRTKIILFYAGQDIVFDYED